MFCSLLFKLYSGGILNINPINILIFIPIEFVLAHLSELFIGSPLVIK